MAEADDATTCNLVTRRTFLAGLGTSVAVAACAGTGITVFKGGDSSGAHALPGTASTPIPSPPAGTYPITDRSLIVIELGGGNDSLSTIVPLTGRYRDLRRSTAVEDPLPLDSEVGLHPALTSLADMYGRGNVAIVEGLGMPEPDLSHFVSMRRWWDGAPQPDHTGWLGRYLDATAGYERVLAGISVGPGPSPAMLGRSSYVVGISDTSGLGSGIPWWIDDPRDFIGIWSGFLPAAVPITELDPVRKAIATTVEAQRHLAQGLAPLEDTLQRLEADTYSLEGQLVLAAALVASEIRPQVVYVHGNVDFDTHENQQARHGELMAQLDSGINHASAILDAAGAAESTVIMTTSEFGRRPKDNEGGTDHGTASSHLVVGPGVAGGRHGESPSLDRLDADGNLKHTVDFRSLYASVLDGWLGASPDDLLRSGYELLPLFSA